jgi:hypothetical protein
MESENKNTPLTPPDITQPAQESAPSTAEEAQQTIPLVNSLSLPNKPLIVTGILLGFILSGISGYYLGLKQSNKQDSIDKDSICSNQITESVTSPSPTDSSVSLTPGIAKSEGHYTNEKLQGFFEIPENWRKISYSEGLEPSKKGFAIYDSCKQNFCVFFENKEYVDKSDIQAYSSPLDDGRVYGYIHIVATSELLGEKSNDITDASFYDAINERFPEKPAASTSEECGPYYATDKAEKVRVSKYNAVLSISYPACNYESGNPEHKHESYYILLKDNNILVIKFFYDESHHSTNQERSDFEKLLSSIIVD